MTDQGLRIGAMTRHSRLEYSELVRERAPFAKRSHATDCPSADS